MTKMIISFAITFISFGAFANDAGLTLMKVDQIKMRENLDHNGQASSVRRIVKPDFEITLEGGEAEKLQRILPPELSVITIHEPGIEKAFNASFKSLGIYSKKSREASSKMITISCSDATLESSGRKTKVVKTGKTVCKITIEGHGDDFDPESQFGATADFEPKTCK